jgi:hypothetical protein
LQLSGVPDLLSEDRANLDYEHDASSTKTVKGLITEIADGQPVPEDLSVSQTTGVQYVHLNGGSGENDYVSAGQRKTISATVKKLAFKLKKYGDPTGNITLRIYEGDFITQLGYKVWGDAQTLTASPQWCEVTFDTPLVLDQEVMLACEFTGGGSSDYVMLAYNDNSVIPGENYWQYAATWEDLGSCECVYRYTYSYPGISVFNHCDSYEVIYDSEDSLVDVYCPKDSFSIKEGEDRLAVIDKLLFYTGCQRIFKADGMIHVFVPATTGTTYDSEYSLASGHSFFVKFLRDALVVPNKIFVRSPKDAPVPIEGSATSAASYALLPVNDYRRMVVDSSGQATSIATAIVSRLEINAQQGGASVPVNCGAELYDYVKVTDERESDYRVGNIGSITRTYKNYPGRKPEYSMSFSFGRVALKSVRGTGQSNLTSRGFLRRESDGSIPWDDLYNEIAEIEYNLHDINIALGWYEAETPAEKAIQAALAGYLKNVVEDTTPQLGGDLDTNGKKITNLVAPSSGGDAVNKTYADTKLGNVVEDTTPQLGGNLDTNDNIVNFYLNNIRHGSLYPAGSSPGLLYLKTDSGKRLYLESGENLYLVSAGGYDVVIWPPLNSGVTMSRLRVTRTDVTSSRSLDTSYQPSINFPVLVIVSIELGDSEAIEAVIGATSSPTSFVDYLQNDTGGELYNSLHFIVPAGWYYKLATSLGSPYLFKIIEETIGG